MPTRKTNTKLQNWLNKQKHNFSNKKQIMQNESIRKIWKDFINSNEYNKYFQ